MCIRKMTCRADEGKRQTQVGLHPLIARAILRLDRDHLNEGERSFLAMVQTVERPSIGELTLLDRLADRVSSGGAFG